MESLPSGTPLRTPGRASTSRLEGYEHYPGVALFGGDFRTPEPNNARSPSALLDELPSVSILDSHGAATPGDVSRRRGDDTAGFMSPAILATPQQNMSSSAMFDFEGHSNEAGSWVTVFGFPPSHTAQVIEELLSCGQIVSHIVDTANANWVHVEFETPIGAQRALTKDGNVFGPHGTMMLGVRRRVFPRGAAAAGGAVGRTPQSAAPRQKPAFHNQSLYLSERSNYSVANTLAYAGAPYPQSNSFWSRAMYYVFGI